MLIEPFGLHLRFTFLHAPKEMRSKNMEALRTLLSLCNSETDSLQDTWNAVLECVSRLEFITSTPSIAATIMLGSNQISRDSLLQSLRELAGKPAEQVFVNSVKLTSDSVVEFFTALCGVSAEELKQTPARVFSLQKLVEISYYNMARIRMVYLQSNEKPAKFAFPDLKLFFFKTLLDWVAVLGCHSFSSFHVFFFQFMGLWTFVLYALDLYRCP